MTPRSPHEAHRTATPLELFFDLVFVVAIAQAAAELHHAVSEAHAVQGLMGYLMVFFAIWWAWMNFTWSSLLRLCGSSRCWRRAGRDRRRGSSPRAGHLGCRGCRSGHSGRRLSPQPVGPARPPRVSPDEGVWSPVAAGLVLLTPLTGFAVPLTGAILASLVAIKLAMRSVRL